MSLASAYPKTSRFDPRWLPLGVTTLGSFMTILDSNIVNIALPTILQDFHSDLGAGQLVITAYVMALAVVIPLSGFLGERVGMKRLYMFTVAAFTLGSALCGMAWSIESLIFFRVLQGLGGGMLQPLGLAIIFTIITPLERPKFIAILGVPTLFAPLIGPSLGGYIVEYASWRWVFLINVPIGLVNIYLAHRLLKETPIVAETRLDARGLALATVAFPALLLGLSMGTESGWDSLQCLGLIAVGAVALAGFIIVELKHRDPMLRLRLFTIPMFRLSLFVQWIGLFSLFGLNIVIPLYLERVSGMDAATAGRVLLPMGIVAFISMNVASKFYNRFGPRPIVMSGLSVLAMTTFGWSRTGPGSPEWLLVVLASCRGLGLGMFGPILQIVTYNAVPDGQVPRATSLVNMCQRLDTAFSTAVLTTVLIVGLTWTSAPAGTSIAIGDAPMGPMVETFRYAFLLMTTLSICGLMLAFFLRDHVLEEHKRTTVARGVPVKQGAMASEPADGSGS